jgi:hypothetical protein
MENKTRRMCFNINGLLGGLLATFLLLGILVFLTINAIAVQKAEATNFYQIDDQSGLQMNSTANAGHYKLLKGGE